MDITDIAIATFNAIILLSCPQLINLWCLKLQFH